MNDNTAKVKSGIAGCCPLVIILDSDYDRVHKDIEGIIDHFSLDWQGKKVLLKPNIIGSWPPDKGATTHPALVEAVMKAVEKRGGIVWIGDNPGTGGYGRSGQSSERCGIKRIAGNRWVEMPAHPVTIHAGSRYFNQLVISKEILDADFIINIPKFKTHALTTITGSIKNMFGILVGGQKILIHGACTTPRQFSEALVDIYSVRIPDLTIIDAIVGMEGNGPSGGPLRKIGKIIASRDGVAADSVMAAMMGIQPLSVEQLKIAAGHNIGQTGLSMMDIHGRVEKIPHFKLPITIARTGFFGGIGNFFLVAGYGSPKLRVDEKTCRKCGVCMKHCPCQAIILDPYPVFNRKKCIGCFCCFELCEFNSVEVGSLFTRLLRTIFGG